MSFDKDELRREEIREAKNFILVQIERCLFMIGDLLAQRLHQEALRRFEALRPLLPPEVRAEAEKHLAILKAAKKVIRAAAAKETWDSNKARAKRLAAGRYHDLMLETLELIQDAMFKYQLRTRGFTGVDLSQTKMEKADFEVEPEP